MKLEEVQGLFALANIPILNIEPLIDGYGYPPEDPRYTQTLPRCVWWFVKTSVGWIKIGWRKRVIHIQWTDTPIRKIITEESVTKGEDHVHAWSEEDALKYLKALSPLIKEESRKLSKEDLFKHLGGLFRQHLEAAVSIGELKRDTDIQYICDLFAGIKET